MTERAPMRLPRRQLLAGLTALAGGAILAACGETAATTAPTTAATVASTASTAAAPPTALGGLAGTRPATSGSATAGTVAGTAAPGGLTAIPVATTNATVAVTAAPAATTAPAATVATTAPAAGMTGTMAAARRPIEIEFYHIWTAANHPAAQLIETFNKKNTGVTVKGVAESADYLVMLQKAQAAYAANRGPAMLAIPVAYALFADSLLNIPNLDEVAGSERDQFYATLNPAALDVVKQNGKTLGIPIAFSTPVMYYNNDAFKAAGVDPKEFFATWENVERLGPMLKARTGNNPVTSYLLVSVEWMTQSMIQCAGGRVNGDDLKPTMDSAEAQAGIRKIADLAKAGLWQNGPDMTIVMAFNAGTIPSTVSSIASLTGLRNATMGKFELGVSTFPQFAGKPRRMTMGGSFFANLSKDRDQQRASFEFMKFCCSEEGLRIWNNVGYLNPSKLTLPLLPGQENAITQLNEGLTRETQWPGNKGPEVLKTWRDSITRMWTNDIGVEDGTRQAKAEITRLLG